MPNHVDVTATETIESIEDKEIEITITKLPGKNAPFVYKKRVFCWHAGNKILESTTTEKYNTLDYHSSKEKPTPAFEMGQRPEGFESRKLHKALSITLQGEQ